MTEALEHVKTLRLPFAEMLGLTVTGASRERITGEMKVRGALCTSGPVLHGGAIMALADTLGALGAYLHLDDGAATTTIESKTNFLGPAPLGQTVMGEAVPLHLGRRMSVWQTRITTADGRLVAVTTQTQLVLR